MKRAAAGLMLLALSACTTAKVDLADFVPPKPHAARLESDPQLTTAALPYADSDPHDFTGLTPAAYPVHGIDISKYQGDIDWSSLRGAGISFVYMKATEGGDHVDERFPDYWSAAASHNIPRGAYHFFYFCRPAIEQARWFERNVPVDRGALPPVLDIEWNAASPTCRLRPDPATVRREMQVFMDEIERHFGKRPIIYTTPDFFRANLAGAFPGHEFWLRSVAGHPSEVYSGGHHWRFWQYTGTGIVPGVDGRTDINAFGGSTADWQAWLKRNDVRL